MSPFFIFEKRNLEAGLGKSDFLQRVEIFDLLLPALVQDCVRESEKAAARPDFIGVGSSGESFAGLPFEPASSSSSALRPSR